MVPNRNLEIAANIERKILLLMLAGHVCFRRVTYEKRRAAKKQADPERYFINCHKIRDYKRALFRL